MAWADEFTAALGGDYSTHSDPVPYPALYQWYVSQGIPSDVARSMVSNPSYGEGEQRGRSDWPYAYRGRSQELAAGQQNRRDQPLQNQLESRLGLDRNISYSPGGGAMPPWNTMTPQQQQQFLQLIMSRGTGGMQPGSMPMMQAQQVPGLPAQTGIGFNPLANQQQNPMMNQQLMQYLMGLQGSGATSGGMQGPTLAQLLSMHGAGLGL